VFVEEVMNEPREMVILPCGCGAGYPVVCPVDQVGRIIHCPQSGMEMRVVGERPFGKVEWDTTSRVGELDICLFAFGTRPTRRQQRLILCCLAHQHFNQYRSSWFWEAVASGEQWADDGTPPFGVDDLRRKLAARGSGGTPSLHGWKWLADACIALFPSVPTGHDNPSLSRVVADIYREFTPNPFVPLSWNPDWFTSTVRDLAAHIYESREFSAMPILADALQDAGCNDEQILMHCRANKSHARGCWVLDAILGKS
jgi:hypothetical protein